MKKILLVISVSTCLFFACNNANNADEAQVPDAEMPNEAATQTTDPAIIAEPAQAQPATVSEMGTQAPASNVAVQPSTVTAAGMNPPHGQPGHKCEIAVGAPLNSAPTGTSANNTGATKPAISTSPVMTSIPNPTTNSAPAQTAPGMNPPHGQPGHDCAIAVGAPLKK